MLLAVVALSGCASRLDTAGPTTSSLPDSSAAPASQSGSAPASGSGQCIAASLRLGPGDGISPETGEHPFDAHVTNAGTTRCWLEGYPHVVLLDAAGRELPFVYHDGGGYVTTAAPNRVWLSPGQQASVLFAKYRCDLGDTDVATSVEFHFPGTTTTFSIDVDPDGPVQDYCGPGDAGDEVDVSPIEPDVVTAIGWSAPPPASSLAPS